MRQNPALAPIVLFVYARPEHSRKVLEALAKNPEARESILYIFADGPSDGASTKILDSIREVRLLIRERLWCGIVHIQESLVNRGLADSIVAGVTEVITKHGRAIVLEDDIALERGALSYFNEALELYQDDAVVMQVSGFMVRTPWWAPSTGFLRVSSSWGWATWARAWKHYSGNSKNLREQIDRTGRCGFDLGGASFHYDELCRNERGELRTWAVKWYASIFLQGGLCLYPRRSLLRNLGFDGSGENCENDGSAYFEKLPTALTIKVSRRRIEESKVYLVAMRHSFQYRLKIWTGSRLRDRVSRKLRGLRSRCKLS